MDKKTVELEKEHDYTVCTCGECVILRAIFNIVKIKGV